MSSPRHICQGGTAAALVRTAVGENVLEIPDDCAIGPLTDVDSSSPDARVAFWTELFAWERGMRSMDWRAEFCAASKALADLNQETAEIVIWAGAHPTEQIMRRRVHWWLKDSPVLVSEVLGGTEDVTNPDGCIHVPIALVSVERLRACFERRAPLTIENRRQLATEWAVLRENGCGIRIWEGGHLAERQIDHYDAILLSLVVNEPVRFEAAVGLAMAETGRSDTFCKWRFASLLQAGKISLVHGNLHAWRSASVRRNGGIDTR